MSLVYVVRPAADRDIDDIADYLSSHASDEIALRFIDEISVMFKLLASHPNMRWRLKTRHRRLKATRVFRVSERFAQYLIFYRLRAEQIEVLRVLQGSQDFETLFSQIN